MTKFQAISALLVERMNKGQTIQQAIDGLMGEGTYAKLVHEVYTELRAKAGL